MKNKKTIRFIAMGAATAALYAGATLLLAPISYGPVQFRLSEVLTTLCVFTPAAIPGLTIGCFLGNLASPFGWMDWVFGSLATLLAAITGRALRNVRPGGIPWLSLLMPVVFNAVIVGAEITLFFEEKGASLRAFLINGAWVGLGELVVCVIGGALLVKAIDKSKSLKKEFK
ncbi:MAG: QueT transporter family protein [Clostridia bacterium]|nr:QueT transporter family protein [Clostridia bacterium]